MMSTCFGLLPGEVAGSGLKFRTYTVVCNTFGQVRTGPAFFVWGQQVKIKPDFSGLRACLKSKIHSENLSFAK